MTRLNELTINQLSSMYKNKEISVKEVTQEYLNRIKQIDQGPNGLNSVLEINPDALQIAEHLDNNLNEYNSKLYGVPILLKDNIGTADKMHTSAGSLALADSIPASDAEIVKPLRSKGALIFGKTNMTEFANYMTKGMPASYSSRGGIVRSPYKDGADPAGSSTGSAVSVTTNLCMASIGTDTSDSIVAPSIKNGIVGFQPSVGTLSQKGIIPISFTCDAAGPMTRTVMDSIIIFEEMIGKKISDNLQDNKKMTVGLNEWALKNMNPEEVKKAESIIKEIEKSGNIVKYVYIEPTPRDDIKEIQKYEFKYGMNQYLATLPKEYHIKDLEDIIEFNNQHAEITLKYGQSLLIDALLNTRGDMKEEAYLSRLKDRDNVKRQMYETLKDLDICIMFRENLKMQYTALPIITVPHGLYNDGMPYGICMTALTDENLLKNSYALEQLIGMRVPPKLFC